MRIVLALVLAVITAPATLSADLRYPSSQANGTAIADDVGTYARRWIATVRRGTCAKCPGSRLPLGGLRPTHQARLPLGGLGRYCPPEVQTRQVVLIRKG